jgi:hypothetical protein
MAVVMTDGIADDLVPLQKQAQVLLRGLADVLAQRKPEPALLDLIGYEKRDSADDRTLVVLYRAGGWGA